MTIPLINYPTFRPYNNFTPFTYRDGLTYLEVLEELRNWLATDLVPYLNTEMEELTSDFQQQVNDLIAQVNILIEALNEEGSQAEDALEQIIILANQVAIDAAASAANAAAAQAAATAADGSATEAEMWANHATAAFVVATVERFGVDPTGVADSTAALNAAVDATPIAGTLIIPKGIYKLNSRVVVDKSITVNAYGAEFVSNAGTSGLQIIGGFEAPFAVVATNPVSVTMEGGNSVNGIALTVTTPPTTWKRGQAVKLFADNVVAEGRPEAAGLAARVGQILTVHSVVGDIVTLLGEVHDTYTINVRIARFVQDVDVAINGATFTVSDSILTALTPNNLVRIEATIGTRFKDIKVKNATGPAIGFLGCFQHSVDGFTFGYGVDIPASSNLGYGILDVNGSYGNFNRLYGKNVRHLYTDDNDRIIVGTSDPMPYGRTEYAIITNSVGDSSSQNPFDTHHGAIGTTFQNCIAINSVRGFQLRGINQRIINCKGIGNRVDIQVYTESTGGETHGHTITNFNSLRNSNTVIDFQVHQSGHPNAGVRDTIPNTIRGLDVQENGGYSVYNRFSTVNIIGASVEAAPTLIDGAAFLFSVGGLTTILGELHLDYRKNTAGAGLFLFRLGIAQASTNYFIMKCFVAGITNARFTAAIENTSIVTAQIDEIIFSNAAPTVIAQENFSNGANSTLKWRAVGLSQNDWNIFSSTAIETAANLAFIAQRITEQFIVTSALGANRTMAILPVAKFGQRVTVINATSSGDLTIVHGAGGLTNLIGATNKVLTPGQSIELVYTNASNWRQIGAVA